MQNGYAHIFLFQQAAFGRRRIRDWCPFTVLRSKYAQMQVDISTLRVWPQIAVLVIGNKLYHASRNKLIPLHEVESLHICLLKYGILLKRAVTSDLRRKHGSLSCSRIRFCTADDLTVFPNIESREVPI